MTFSTTIHLPKVDYNNSGRRNCAVDIEVELRERDNDEIELSICGSVWNPGHTDIYSGGQNDKEIAALFPQNARVQRLVEIWRRWHLNTMRAGCEHQRALGWDKEPIDASKPTNTYGLHFPGQKQASWNLLSLVREDEHPGGKLSKPCPECGYRYGSAWVTEKIPSEIITELKVLCGVES